MTLKEHINAAILDALRRNGWSRTRAAKDLDCSLRTVRNHIKDMMARGIDVPYSESLGGRTFRYPHDKTCTCKNTYCIRDRRVAKFKQAPVVTAKYCHTCGNRMNKRCARCQPTSQGGFCTKCGKRECPCDSHT